MDQWKYSETTDKMTDERVQFAKTSSLNSVVVKDLPSAKKMRLFLTLSHTGKMYKVEISSDEGYLLWRKSLRIRFGSEIRDIPLMVTPTNDKDILVVHPSVTNEVIKSLQKVDTARIEVEIYHHGIEVFNFNTSDFPKKFNP